MKRHVFTVLKIFLVTCVAGSAAMPAERACTGTDCRMCDAAIGTTGHHSIPDKIIKNKCCCEHESVLSEGSPVSEQSQSIITVSSSTSPVHAAFVTAATGQCLSAIHGKTVTVHSCRGMQCPPGPDPFRHRALLM